MPIKIKSKATGLLILIGIFWVLFNPPQSTSSAERKVCPKVEPKVGEAITLERIGEWGVKSAETISSLYSKSKTSVNLVEKNTSSQNFSIVLEKNSPNPLIVKQKKLIQIKPIADKPKIVVANGKQEITNEICRYNWNDEQALRVAMCESGIREEAIGDKHIYPHSYGVFQIRALSGRPAPAQLLDYKTNINYAYQLWQSQGWYPWTCARKLGIR